VLVACEVTGAVRDAFRSRGHYALSCDLQPSEVPGPHYTGDARSLLDGGWDLLIAHPPCQYLASSGLHWTTRGLRDPELTADALAFVRELALAPIPRICIENPIGAISTRLAPATQVIQPWQYGHPESKATALWLLSLPPLRPTNVLPLPACGHWENQTPDRQNRLGESKARAAIRARTYPGIAAAMADQWGALPPPLF
jgi:hypothetical protein